jgi:hypothetical protein
LKTGSKIAIIAGGMAALFIVAAACGAGGSESPARSAAPTSATGEIYHPGDTIPTSKPPTTFIPFPAASGTLTPTTPSGLASTISDGTYEVGADMEAGKYKGQCPAFGYWARLKNNDGSVEDIIANNVVGGGGGPMTFTAKSGEYVEVRNCVFTKVG